MKGMRASIALLCGILLAGCNVGVSQSDTAAVRKEFSQENYEKAMKAAGKGAELEKEKEAAAQRGD